jgi:hypothetical protein
MADTLWSYGITTVPERANDLLPQTVESLARAGFYNPTLFMDGDCDNWRELPTEIPVVVYRPHIGHMSNWIIALLYLYSTNRKAQCYALFEDDILACSNLFSYLNNCRYPENGYWNLLTHNENLVCTGPTLGWHTSNQRGRGAAGLVFDRRAIQTLLSSETLIHRLIDSPGCGHCPDGLVMNTLGPLGFKEYVHYPSLIQHVGTVSTLGHRYGTVKGFKGEDYNPMTILEGTNHE